MARAWNAWTLIYEAPGTARTYEAASHAIAPKVAAKHRSCALPLESEGPFFASLTAVLLLEPKSVVRYEAARSALELCKAG